MKVYFKRGLSVLLCATLALAFAGCGKKKESGSDVLNEATKMSKDYVFAMEEFNVDGLPKDINRIFSAGDRIYASYNNSSDFFDIYSFNSDGSDLKNVKLPYSDNSYYQNISFDKDGNIYAIYNVYNWSSGDMELYDGEGEETVEAVEDSSEESIDDASENASEDTLDEFSDNNGFVESSDEYYLVKFDLNGNEVYKIDLGEKYGDDEGYVSINSMGVTDDGVVILSMDNGILSYTPENDFKLLVDNSTGADYRYYQIYKGFEGQIFLSYYGDDSICLCSFDPNTGKISDPSSAIKGYGDYSYFGGSGYDLYISDDKAFYGYDKASDTKTKLLDYVDSDIELTGSTDQAVAISDVEFIASIPDADYNYSLYRLTKVPPEEVKDKEIITLGGYYIDYTVRRLAYEYNRNSNEYKIKFVDYSAYDEGDTYGAGSDQFNMDIVSGNTPDIIMIGYEMPVDSYINKGLFLDLTPYFAKDTDISESDLLTNIVDAFKTGDKIYQVVPSFQIGTMAVKTKYTEGKSVLSFDDCKKLIEQTGVSAQNAFGLMNREAFLEYGLSFAGDSYIDWANKTCHFDSESFVNFLEFSKNFPEDIPDSAYEDYKDTMYLNDESLFSFRIMSGFRDFAESEQGYFGEKVSYVGYPNDFGVNNSIIYPDKRIAISAQSKHADAAWEFVKKFYSDEYQKDTYEFPVKKSAFEEKVSAATQKPFYMDGDERIEYEDYTYIGGEEIELKPMTQEEVTEVVNFIKSMSLVYNSNQSVNDIISEEASAFYSGQKSAKEVADIIQSRVSIYVNENS